MTGWLGSTVTGLNVLCAVGSLITASHCNEFDRLSLISACVSSLRLTWIGTQVFRSLLIRYCLNHCCTAVKRLHEQLLQKTVFNWVLFIISEISSLSAWQEAWQHTGRHGARDVA